jgi:hypothetical protein
MTCSLRSEICTQVPPEYKAVKLTTWLRLPAVRILTCTKYISQYFITVVVSSEVRENNSKGRGRNMCTATELSPWKHSWSRNMMHLLSELKPDSATKMGALCSPETLDTHQALWYSACSQKCLVWISADLQPSWHVFLSLMQLLGRYVD